MPGRPACGLLTLCYLLIFFQRGANLYDTFLRRKASPYSASAWTYSGKNHWGRVRIDVEAVESNTYRLIYALPGNPERDYLVRFAGAEDRYAERQIVISSGGVERFRGTYHPDGLFLYNEQGEPVARRGRLRLPRREKPLCRAGALLLRHGAAGLRQRRHGAGQRRPPLFGGPDRGALGGGPAVAAPLFDLRHMWWCVGAEPSELFLSAQRLLWVVLPILSIFLALLALIIH